MSKSPWWPAEGTIVDVENAFGHHDQKYTIEVRKFDGPLIRRVVKHKAVPPYDVGTRVKVQISDSNEIRFDPSAPGEAAIIATMDMADQIAEASASFDDHSTTPRFADYDKPAFGSFRQLAGDQNFITFSVASGAGVVGTPTHSLPGVLTLLRQEPAATSVVMTGPDGREVQIDRGEISELAHAMTSDEPGVRAAAIEKWHTLKAKVTGEYDA
ncbi:MAG TPA: hypothetical protein VN695_18415 [Streptosporangiaceae bacterium]|nr:hypothetical protein [Streptosporangiaceae bacterium]